MNISGYLISPDNATLATADNSFKSNWCDKRGCPWIGISVVIRGAGTISGTLTLETSNIDERQGAKYGGPDPGASGSLTVANGLATPNNVTNPDDLLTFGGNIAVSQSATTAYQFSPTTVCPSHWIRVKYAATLSSAGMSVSVYYNGIIAA